MPLPNPHRSAGILDVVELLVSIHEAAAREIRKMNANTGLGIVVNLGQNLIMISVMYCAAWVMGFGASLIRGDYLIYVITGIFLYMVHVKTMAAVSSAEGPLSPGMRNIPINQTVSSLGAAIASLWMQAISVAIIMFLYDALWEPLVFQDLAGMSVMIVLAWISGIGLGMLLTAIRPWSSDVSSLISQLYMRVSMILSGSMFVANALPEMFLPWFMWNPLFHMVDQARGAAFINYNPWFTSAAYAAAMAFAILIVGALAQYNTRVKASASWFSKG
ncbi:MAG: hypothetical protein ABJN42_14460 [Roseibium sp.]|uniref:ABC transporter permease n=1 Tax=Roseibium sp. TaxID=1936156 RepID=UPI0032990E0A